jgi:hypothetical protein
LWQQQQQQHGDEPSVFNTHQQQLALQQQWQQHLQHQHSQRQQQMQQQRQRKRPAVDTVDLTVSDSEDEKQVPEAAAAAGPEVQQHADASSSGRSPPTEPRYSAACPCCAAESQEPLDAAVMQRLQRKQGYQQWCAVHRQQQLAAAGDGKWTCRVCTLMNPAAVLACEACLTVKNLI